MYEIRARKIGTKEWQGYFGADTPEGIASLASQLGDEYELKVSTVGHAIETISHPYKGVMIKDILTRTMNMAPIDAPFKFKTYGWAGDANEAIINWTFDNLIQSFQIDTICVSVSNSGRCEYTIGVKRK